jgi:hypothetical protein
MVILEALLDVDGKLMSIWQFVLSVDGDDGH